MFRTSGTRTRRWQHFRLDRVFLAVALCCANGLQVAAQQRQTTVLVLYGGPAGSPLHSTAAGVLREQLTRPLAGRLTLAEEFVDDAWSLHLGREGASANEDGTTALRRYLAAKYAGVRLDLIFIVGSPAFKFYEAAGKSVFPGIPAVACLVSYEEGVRTPLDPLVSIVTDSVDLRSTVALALRLQPDTKHVVAVGGASPLDLASVRRAEFIGRSLAPGPDFTLLVGKPLAELERRLVRLAPHTIILYLTMMADSTGARYRSIDVAERLSSIANAPVYVWNDIPFGRGVVGGQLLTADASVARAVSLARRIIDGDPSSILPRRVMNPTRRAVDWRQLRRWKIDERRLPPGTLVAFREETLWVRHRNVIAAALALIVAQTVVIAALIVQHARRRRAEAANLALLGDLRSSYERIHQLAGRLITAQEAERARIGRELHDDVNQRIAALSIALSQFRSRLPSDPPELASEAARLQDRTASLAADVRQLSHQLHSSVLQHAGLAAALRAMCTEFTDQHGIRVALSVRGDIDQVPNDVALCLYRVGQEALRNTATHARAAHARITVVRHDDAVELSIADDGTGFDASARAPGVGLGLVSLEERVAMLGGTCRVASQLGHGTEINLRLPVSSRPALVH